MKKLLSIFGSLALSSTIPNSIIVSKNI
ncbi:lipoprotein [Spiroplasma endosymbiont of Aspidapion aeneum]